MSLFIDDLMGHMDPNRPKPPVAPPWRPTEAELGAIGLEAELRRARSPSEAFEALLWATPTEFEREIGQA